MALRTIRDVEVQGKRVLMRVDFNVPIEDGKVLDDWRLRATVPTIRYLTERGAKLILMSHLGRPKGKRDEKYSLRPVAQRLSELLGQPVKFADDCIGEVAEKAVAELKPGEVLLLENLRFHEGEEKNDETFAQQLAKLGEIYVNDAFGAAHRAHASVHAVTKFLPAYAGLLMELVPADEAAMQGLMEWRGVRTKRYTYARFIDGRELLYDNEVDPFQLRNLAYEPSAANVKAQLKAELQKWLAKTRDKFLPWRELILELGLASLWNERERELHPKNPQLVAE